MLSLISISLVMLTQELALKGKYLLGLFIC